MSEHEGALDLTLLDVADERGGPANAAAERRLRRIVLEHFEAVWRFLRRLGIPERDVDDAVQEVILVTSRNMARIESGRERAFMFGTAYRVALGMRRARARLRESSDESLASLIDPSGNPEDLNQQKQAREVLDAILASMPIELRAVFVLYEVDGLSTGEIAETLELASGTVASRLRRAREDFGARVQRLQASAVHRRRS